MRRAELNAETAVAGAILIDATCLDAVAAVIRPEDMAEDVPRRIYAAALELKRRGGVIDPVTILDEMGGGDSEYITRLMELTPTAANAGEYAALVAKEARARRLEQIADDIRDGVFIGADAAEIADRARRELDGVESARKSLPTGAESMAAWYERYTLLQKEPESAYCRTGYGSLDRALGGGLFNSEVYILAGRPGMGKTTVGIALAERVAERGAPVLFCSLEMSAHQITTKRIARLANVEYTRCLNGTLSDDDLAEAISSASKLSARPLFVADELSLVSDVERYAREVKDLRLVVIDYLGLLQTGDRPAPRYEEITRISAAIKALAKRLDKPILVLAQLNRENTTRADKKPTLVDLRDSGAIEQDAGGVILLHRDHYYNTDEEPPEREPIEFIIAKNRHSATRTVTMIWSGATGRIDEMTRGMPI